MPKNWNALTAMGQARRVRSLLPELTDRYGWDDWVARKLTHGENTTFDLRPGSGRERFVIRIHRPNYHDAAEIRSELAWLAALREDLGLEVPEPVPDLKGRVLHRLESEVLAEPRHVVVFRWVDGAIRTKRGPDSWAVAGRLLARLHQHSRSWALPRGFIRPDWSVANALDVFGPRFADLPAGSAERAVLDDAAALLLETISGWESDERTLLAHVDLHRWNLLYDGMEPRPIDFDDCAFADPMLDVMVALDGADHRGRKAFTQAYQSECGWPLNLEMLPHYDLLGELMGINWLKSRSDHPRLRKRWREHVDETVKRCREYLNSPAE